jgi:hypothetical protein
MLRARFQSLFWAVFLDKKKKNKFSLTDLADMIGIHKSYVSRSFTNPPNWQIDKISDFADALGLDLEICAVDRETGEVFTPQGKKNSFSVTGPQGSFFETRTSPIPTITIKQEVHG